jgi:hypothetical protein
MDYGIWDGDNPWLIISRHIVQLKLLLGWLCLENLTGNVGTTVDICKLNIQDWVKLKYSDSTWYKFMILLKLTILEIMLSLEEMVRMTL